MGILYRALLPKKVRRVLRAPFWLLVTLFLGTGWLRGIWLEGYASRWIEQLSQHCKIWCAELNVPSAFCQLTYIATFYSIVLFFTFVSVWLVCRLVIDFPGYTKAVFWAVTRAYEHNLSRFEAMVLVAIPSMMSVTILADGTISLAAPLLAALGIYFHTSSYNFSRLRRRTDQMMGSRSNLNRATPPESDAEPMIHHV